MDFVTVFSLLETFGFNKRKCFEIATRYVADDEDAHNVVRAVRERVAH